MYRSLSPTDIINMSEENKSFDVYTIRYNSIQFMLKMTPRFVYL